MATTPPDHQSRKQPPESPKPTLFIDRSLGEVQLPAGLRALGFTVVTMQAQYGDRAQEVDDDEWIHDAAQNGWPALTWDMLRLPRLRQAIADSGARVFRFERQTNTAKKQLEVFTYNQHRFVQRIAKPGPYFDVIRPKRIDRYWRP